MFDLNIRYSNCFEFINNTKQYLEANPTDWRNIYTMEDLIHAECDLMEMELEASYDAEEYDSILNRNTFRTAKKANRRKANIRHHKADRKHGKPVPKSDKKYWDKQSGTFYRWDEKRKTFDSHKKPVVHRNRKTFRDRLDSAMDARELDYASDFSEKGKLMNKVLPTLEDNIVFLKRHNASEELISMCEDYKKDILRIINTATR